MNALVKPPQVKPPQHMMERTDRLYRRAWELADLHNLHPTEYDPNSRFTPPKEEPSAELVAQREEAMVTLAKLEALSRPATREEVARRLFAC